MKVLFSLTGLSLLGYIVAFANQVVISKYLGTNKDLDIYLYALSVVSFCFFFSPPIVEAAVPEFFSKKASSTQSGNENFSKVLNLILLLSAILILFLFLKVPIFLGFFESTQLTNNINKYFYSLWPIIPLTAVMIYFSGILNVLEKYVFQNVGKLVASLFGIVFLVLNIKTLGAMALAYAAVLVLLVHVLFMSYDLSRSGIRYSLSLDFKLGRNFYKVFFVLMVTFLLTSLYLIYEKWALNQFGAGNVSSHGYAYKLFVIPLQVFVFSIQGVIWTKLLKKNEQGGKNESIKELINVTGDAFGCTLIFAVTSFFFSKHIIYLLFFRGNFNSQSLEMTSLLFRYFIIALPFATLYSFQSRLLLTLQRSKILGVAGTLFVLMLFLSTFFAVKTENVIFIPLAQFISNLCVSMYAFLMIRSISDVLTIKVFLKKLIPYLVFILPWGVALYFTSNNLWIENKVLLFFVLSSIYLVGGAYFIYDLYKKSKAISLNGDES